MKAICFVAVVVTEETGQALTVFCGILLQKKALLIDWSMYSAPFGI